MRLQFQTNYVGEGMAFAPGDVAEIPEEFGKTLTKANMATVYKAPDEAKPKAAPVARHATSPASKAADT